MGDNNSSVTSSNRNKIFIVAFAIILIFVFLGVMGFISFGRGGSKGEAKAKGEEGSKSKEGLKSGKAESKLQREELKESESSNLRGSRVMDSALINN